MSQERVAGPGREFPLHRAVGTCNKWTVHTKSYVFEHTQERTEFMGEYVRIHKKGDVYQAGIPVRGYLKRRVPKIGDWLICLNMKRSI